MTFLSFLSFLSLQVENQDLGRVAAEKPQGLLAAHPGAVALAKGSPVQRGRPAGHLDPGMASRREREITAFAVGELRHPDVDILRDREGALPSVPAGEKDERPRRQSVI